MKEVFSAAEVLIIRPNDEKSIYGAVAENKACEPPFWAAVLAAGLRKADISVAIYDAEAMNASPEDVTDYALELPSLRLVVITVTGNNLSASTWKMHGAGLTAEILKEKGVKAPLLMWGLHPSALPERTLCEESIDFVLRGEGVGSLVQLTRHLGDRKFYSQIKGLYYKKTDIHGGTYTVEGNSLIDLLSPEEFPEPLWELLPMERYLAHNWQRFGDSSKERGRYAVIATALGCPFSCNFCAVSALFGKKFVRNLPVEHVLKTIDNLVINYHTKYIKIIDECFVLDKKHVKDICEGLMERNYDLNIWAYARVDTVDEEILALLKKAGIKWLAYGIESAGEKSLQASHKGKYVADDVRRVMKMTKDAGISIMANFMFGLPEDTRESMQETLNLAREINPEFINFYCTMAYPGSALYGILMEEHPEINEKDDWLKYSEYSYECEPLSNAHLTGAEVLAFRDKAFNDFFRDNKDYWRLVEEKFGMETVKEIEDMLHHKLKRRLLGD